MRKLMYIYCLMVIGALFCLSSCRKQEVTVSSAGGIKVVLATMPPQTRATSTPGDGLVADGGGIYMDNTQVPDLNVLIFDEYGDLAAYYPHDALSTDKPTHRIVRSAESSNSALEIEVTFKKTKNGADFDDGEYSLYAIANTTGLWNMISASSVTFNTWNDVLSALVAGTLTESEFKTLQFADLAAGHTPAQLNSRLPLSAVGDIVITGNTGIASAQMLRCLCKVNITIENNTGLDLTVDGLAIGEISANTGYLIQQEQIEEDDEDYDVPSGATYSGITILERDNDTDDIIIGHDDEDPDSPDYHIKKVVADKYLFPNANDGEYLISLRLGGEEGRTTYSHGDAVPWTSQLSASKEYFIRFSQGEAPGYIYQDNTATGTQLLIEEDSALTEVPTGAEFRWRIIRNTDIGASNEYYADVQNVGSGEYVYASGAAGTYYERTITYTPGYAYEIISAATKPSLLTDPIAWKVDGSIGNGGYILNQLPTADIRTVQPTVSQFYLTRGKSLTYQSGNDGNTEPDVYVHSGIQTNTRVSIIEAIENIHGEYNDLPIRDKSNRNITKIDRNQNLDIRIRIAKTSSFGFELDAWTAKEEYIHFD